VTIEKRVGFNRIFQADSFAEEVNNLFGKGSGEKERYLIWLRTWLRFLDDEGLAAIDREQFEYIKGTIHPQLYAIRHPHSNINERYLYTFFKNEFVILLTVFKEKSASDYKAQILRATNIYLRLESE
jgi:hypothetical protein